MRTKAVRLHGEGDLRLEEFELPEITEDEMLAKVVSDTLCMSSYKAAIQGERHKRVPGNLSSHPVVVGHEFCGEVIKAGQNVRQFAQPGDKFTVQPVVLHKDGVHTAGYFYPCYGGDATYIVIPSEVFEKGCFLKYEGEAFYHGSLAEPMSCIAGGAHVNYHTTEGRYVHEMGIRQNGRMAMLGGAGPMGLGTIDYTLHAARRPSLLVVADTDEKRLARASQLFPKETAQKQGVKLHFVNPSGQGEKRLQELAEGCGYDDVYVLAPVKEAVEMADRILGQDGCLNFFAGPTDQDFQAVFNFYRVHYATVHVAGNSGGNTDDMREVLDMMGKGELDPSVMITHVGGLNCVPDVTMRLPEIPGGKKLIYTQIDMPLTAIADFTRLGEKDPLFTKLAKLVRQAGGLWSPAAERCLLQNAKPIG